jgi:ribosomal protein S18 acetylase RimI-like enzyme
MSILESTFAIESNLFDFFRTVARLSKRTFYTDKHISWVNCAPSPWPCEIFDTNFSIENVNENIMFVKNQIEHGIAPKIWVTGPSMHPKNLDEQLMKCGFAKRDEATGMALDFSKLKSDVERIPGFDIQIVTDEKNLRDWAGVVESGLFGGPDNASSSFYELMTTVLHCDKVMLFVGYCEGSAVASSTLFVSNGIAGIYHVVTLPPFRKKGIGRSMTLAPLLQAREMGSRFAVLQAAQIGKGIFSRLGFTEYCMLNSYMLNPSSTNGSKLNQSHK